METKTGVFEGACCCKPTTLEPGEEISKNDLGRNVWKLGVSLALAGQSMMLGLGVNMGSPDFGSSTYWVLHGILITCAFVVMVLLGGDLVSETVAALKRRKISVEGLFLLSMFGAFVGSLVATFTGVGDVYYEVVAIVLCIYTIGKLIGKRSRSKAIEAAQKLRHTFDYAYIMVEGEKKQVKLEELNCCSRVVVGPGDAISVDGIILSGEGFVKETAMTGELEPESRRVGDSVFAGTYSVDGTFEVKPTGLKGSRRLDGLISTVESASLGSSSLQDQADRIMQWFLPFVVTLCLGTFLFWVTRTNWNQALFNSMAVLLVACPCAIGLATPIAIWSGLWKLSSLGIIARTGAILDALARTTTVCFDKTGTLSEENLRVREIVWAKEGVTEEKRDFVIGVMKAVEARIDHPIARALSAIRVTAHEKVGQMELIRSTVFPGKGIEAVVGVTGRETTLQLGSRGWMEELGFIEGITEARGGRRSVYLAMNGELYCEVVLEENMRAFAFEVLDGVKEMGVQTVILTGDPNYDVGRKGGIAVWRGMSPQDKVDKVKELQEAGEVVIFIGDGVNDAAAMSESDGAIAIGEGVSLAQSTASAVMMGKRLSVLPEAIGLCRRIKSRLRGNMLFAACYNVIGMGLAASGLLHPVVAALLMVVSSAWVSYRAIQTTR